MEDAYYADHRTGFFAVYDGHGGARCSAYAAQHLHHLVYKHIHMDSQTGIIKNLQNGTTTSATSSNNTTSNSSSTQQNRSSKTQNSSNSNSSNSQSSSSHSSNNSQNNISSSDESESLKNSNNSTKNTNKINNNKQSSDQQQQQQENTESEGDESIITGIRDAFDELDKSWLSLATLNNYDDGSTAIVVLIHNKILYVANCGDSRCVLLSAGGHAQDMSVDHKPNSASEKQRVEALGGRIIYYGTWRVEGILAVTRSIGDRRLKRYVSSRPDIVTRKLRPGDDFLILASDGVWDVLSSQASCDLVLKGQNSQSNQSINVKDASTRITNQAYNLHSMDNITSMVVDLRSYR
jgi:protein phosphatase 2C